MVKIKAFPAVTYNYDKIRRPDKIICPPYDVITPQQVKSYRNSSPYNTIYLTLPKKSSSRNQYQKATLCFQDWLKQGILSQDKHPAMFFYQQKFKCGNAGFTRLGFIACLGLKKNSYIHGHEHTRIEPKEDRLKLLTQVQANLEPIFVLFPDSSKFLEDIFKRYIRHKKPLVRFRDQEKNMNILWRLTNPEILTKIEKRMSSKVLFIADGHHRYEVSLNYQKQMHRAGNYSKDCDYIMAYFCPIPSSGLVIRPIHRLVKGIDDLSMAKFRKFFHIQKAARKEIFKLVNSQPKKQRKIGVYAGKDFYILTLKNKQALNRISKHYRPLDVCLLNDLIFKRIMRLKPDDKEKIIFSASIPDLIRQADREKNCFVFFLTSVKINDIISLAKIGRKMPSKTTYFYPKVPSGLAMYKFSQ